MFNRNSNGDINVHSIVREIFDWALEEKGKQDSKFGVLICEGDENSIDNAVYSLVFPDLMVVPVGGCSTVSRLLPRLRDRLSLIDMYVFGIIDRDALSKKETRRLYQKSGLYTTKLPFIENIICSPEVIRYVCDYTHNNYDDLINKIETELLKILWQKLKEALPINLGIEKNERIEYLGISASTKKQTIKKRVDKGSILYSYRDKVITMIVGNHIGLNGKKAYYDFMKELIANEEYKDALSKTFSKFLPKLELYDF